MHQLLGFGHFPNLNKAQITCGLRIAKQNVHVVVGGQTAVLLATRSQQVFSGKGKWGADKFFLLGFGTEMWSKDSELGLDLGDNL